MYTWNRRTAPLRSSLTLALLAVIHAAAAQDTTPPAAPAPPPAPIEEPTTLDKVTVVGSHIQGASTTDALPVMVGGASWHMPPLRLRNKMARHRLRRIKRFMP